MDRQDPGLVFARGNRFFLNVKGSTWSPYVACGFCGHLATCVFFPIHSCLLLAIATNDASDRVLEACGDLAVMPGRKDLRLTEVTEAGHGR